MSPTTEAVMDPKLTLTQNEPVIRHKTMARLIFERFVEHRLAVVSVFIILMFAFVAFGADLIATITGLDPDTQDVLHRYAPFSAEHWLGTDELGRDVFIRLIYGTRISLGVAIVSTIASLIIGITIGSIAGYYGGFIDTLLMRLTDALLSHQRSYGR
jgi:peptide/nickel transport system permease protein